MLKKAVSAILALGMLAGLSINTFAVGDAVAPYADESEGSIGQTYVGVDGTRVKFFNGEKIDENARMTSTVYNGYIFDHDSRWSGNGFGNQAQAETESYLKGNYNVPHRNYTRVRVVNSLIPAIIYDDTDRCWGDRYSSAESMRSDSYFEIDFAMRSYWGDSTT